MKLLVLTILATLCALASAQGSITVKFDGNTYEAAPFVFDDPKDLYNYQASQANTWKDQRGGPLTTGIEQHDTAVIAFVRTNSGVYLTLIFDKPGPRAATVGAHIEVKCTHDGVDVTQTSCKNIFTSNKLLCDDGPECNDLGTTADGFLKVGKWKWAPGYTDGMVTNMFPSGCIELQFRVKNDANYDADHLKHLSVVSRHPLQPHTPVFLSPIGDISSTVTVNFCASPAPVNCLVGKAWSRGDPHFRSMDGTRFDYQGRGTHLFCAPLNNAMDIQTCHQDRFPGSKAATNRAIAVQVADKEKLFFGVTSHKTFRIYLHSSSGAVQDLTNLGTGKSVLLEMGSIFGNFQGSTSRITVYHRDGWRLQLRGRFGKTMLVDILSFTGPQTENPGTEGLCGNFDCDNTNDFMLPNQTLASSINEFGTSWQLPDDQSLFLKFPNAATLGTATCPSNDPNPAPGPTLPDPINCASPQNSFEQEACTCCQNSCQGSPGACDLQDYNDCLFDVATGLEAGDDLSEVCGNTETPTCSDCPDPQVCGDNGQCQCPNGIGTPDNGCLPDECVQDTPGISRGDPHFITIDGKRYDYQGRGLFTFCQAGDVEVQTCQVDRSATSHASINGAVAIKVGEDIFQLGKEGGQGSFIAKVNGQVITLNQAPSVIGNSGAIAFKSGSIYEVRYNGHKLVAKTRNNRVIDVKYFPAQGASTTGLCGSNDCDRSNDFTIRGTDSIVVSPSDFGDSYKLAPSDSGNLLAGTGFQCDQGNEPPPPPSGGPPTLPDCAATPSDPICSCCSSKQFDATADFDDCVFDLTEIYATAEAESAGSGAAAVATACTEEVANPCPDDCAGDCDANGQCICPGGGTPPLCLEPPGCTPITVTYVPGQTNYDTLQGPDGCVCINFV